MSQTPPGWYPDAEGPQMQRYRDGSRWTGAQPETVNPTLANAAARPRRPGIRGSFSWWRFGICLIAIAAILMLADKLLNRTSSPTNANTSRVTISVKGFGGSLVELITTDINGNVQQYANPGVPWSENLTLRAGTEIVVGAQNSYYVSGLNERPPRSVECAIASNGSELTNDTSAGQSSTVQCVTKIP